MEILKAVNIEKKYADELALDNVSLTIPKGSIYGLLGPNGAGKTTLIRIVNQITGPDKGQLFFKGNPLKSTDVHHIGYLPEERGLYKKMKVGEQVLYLAQLKGLDKPNAMKKIKHWFEKLEIQGWWNKKVEELSKGMQQKIQFIVTILHEPELLIFDEPFSGFDPINADILKKEILLLRDKGATIIFSTHNMGSVEELCDHITLINKSRTILEGQVKDVKQQFKSNVYEFSFLGDQKQLEEKLGNFEIIERELSSEGKHRYKVKILNGLTENDLISAVISKVQMKSFREIIPNMDEIFIRAVKESVN